MEKYKILAQTISYLPVQYVMNTGILGALGALLKSFRNLG